MSTSLKSLRLSKGMTQQEVFELAGISKSYYSELESGKRQLNERLMKRLSEVFGVPAYLLMINPENESDFQFVTDLSLLDETQRKLVHDLAASLAGAKR